ncbi:hypothetical protein [Streptomyces sp. NPDC003483]
MTAVDPPTGESTSDLPFDLRVDLDALADTRTKRFTFTAHPTDEPDDTWWIAGDVVRVEGRGLKVVRLEVEVDPDGPTEITGTLMRQIPIGTLLDYVRGSLAAEFTDTLASPAAPTPTVPAGRTPLTDDFLRDVAISYLRETAPGRPRGATRRLAETYGRPEETIRTWIGRARRAGWLGPSAKGRAGAEPGPKLSEWQLEELKRRNPGLISHVRVEEDESVTDLSDPDSE